MSEFSHQNTHNSDTQRERGEKKWCMFRVLVVSDSVVPRTVPCSAADTLCDAMTEAQPFSTGNPAVEQIDGTVHLFRSVPGASGACCTQNSRVVAIVAVPSYITTPQLVRFISSSPTELELPSTTTTGTTTGTEGTDLSCFATAAAGTAAAVEEQDQRV